MATDAGGSEDLGNGYRLEWRWMGGGPYADALWTKDLGEDDDGGWAFPGEMLVVGAFCGDEQIGEGNFSYLCEGHGGHLACFNVLLADEHRRRGLATAMYDRAESEFGDTVLPYPGNEGGAIQDFWVRRLADRPDLLEQHRDSIGGPALTWRPEAPAPRR